MTDRELMQKALEALGEIEWSNNSKWQAERASAAITALRERLAQPEPAPGYCPHCKQYTIEEPMRREWVGLTEEEMHPECKKTVMAEYKFQTYAAYKADGEMKIGVVRMKPVPLHPNLPTPTTAFGNPAPIAQYYTCPHCNKPSPLVREWVGLTLDDVGEIELWVDFKEEGSGRIPTEKLVRYIEAKLREKNA